MTPLVFTFLIQYVLNMPFCCLSHSPGFRGTLIKISYSSFFSIRISFTFLSDNKCCRNDEPGVGDRNFVKRENMNIQFDSNRSKNILKYK